MARLLEWAGRLLPSLGLALVVASLMLVPRVATAEDPDPGPLVDCGTDCNVACQGYQPCKDNNCNRGGEDNPNLCSCAAASFASCATKCKCYRGFFTGNCFCDDAGGV